MSDFAKLVKSYPSPIVQKNMSTWKKHQKRRDTKKVKRSGIPVFGNQMHRALQSVALVK